MGKTKTLGIPVFLSFPLVEQIMLREVFNQPDKTAHYRVDTQGCSVIIFANPKLSENNGQLRVVSDVKAHIGVNVAEQCSHLTEWKGRTILQGTPTIANDNSLIVQFEIKNAKIFDQQGNPLADGIVLEALENQLKSFLSQLKFDLKPTTKQLKQIFPTLLPNTTKSSLNKLIKSLGLHSISTVNDGLSAQLTLDYDPQSYRTKPPVRPLTVMELSQLEKKWQTWDAFLTYVIKQAAATTQSPELRSALLNVLLDARYQFQASLIEASRTSQDPIKQLFIRGWSQLEPVLRQLSLEKKNSHLLPLLSFMTASEALNVLDKVGPELGLEISEDGLRRLARLLNKNPSLDPLEYLEKTDPELQQLFNLGKVTKPRAANQPFSLNIGLISSANADNNWEKIQPWIPPNGNINQYLTKVSHLLLQKVKQKLNGSELSPDIQNVYRYLVLTTAWQESCWRQFVIERQQVTPLKSGTGDIGLFQVNERVWRGFYNLQKLRWDIAYNADSGSEILIKYMVNYALKKNEHQHIGGLDNLARSSYSTYNGGPAQVSRYRSSSTKATLKTIDQSFWGKYQKVKESHELEVASCYSGNTNSRVKHEKLRQTIPKTATKASPKQSSTHIATKEWILSQNPVHYTVQLVALHDEKNIHSFINKLGQTGNYAYFQDNKGLFRIIYSSFEGKAEAERQALRFRKIKPWIRTFASIHQSLKK